MFAHGLHCSIVHVYGSTHYGLQLATHQLKSALPRFIFSLATCRFEWHSSIAIAELSVIEQSKFTAVPQTFVHPSNFREGINWTRDGPLLSTVHCSPVHCVTAVSAHVYIIVSQHCANDSHIFGRTVELRSLLDINT